MCSLLLFSFICVIFLHIFFTLCRLNAKLSCRNDTFYLERVGFLCRSLLNCQDDKKTQYLKKNPTTFFFFLLGNIKYCEASEWHQLHYSLVIKKTKLESLWEMCLFDCLNPTPLQLKWKTFPHGISRQVKVLSHPDFWRKYICACVCPCAYFCWCKRQLFVFLNQYSIGYS